MDKKHIKIRLSQLNSFVGELELNFNKIKNCIIQAINDKVDIIAFPELSITGYPPEDLLFKKKFISDNLKYLNKIKLLCKDIICIIGFVDRNKSGLYNSAAVITDKKIMDVYHKLNLPNYSVFDEQRYFCSGDKIPVYSIENIKFGISICEDIWVAPPPIKFQAKSGINLLININASPYYMAKPLERIKRLKKLTKKFNITIAYVNMVGGQDEIIFDGNSMVINNKGEIEATAKQFQEDYIDYFFTLTNLKKHSEKPNNHIKKIPIPYTVKNNILKKSIITPLIKNEAEIYNALVLGVRDYVIKNGFSKVIIGLSGGIDSALTTAIAVDALGEKNVVTIFMPSKFTSDESYIDAKQLAKNLKINMHIISIKNIYNEYIKNLSPLFKNTKFNIAEENIQARIRGNLLMALSNKFGYLVLTTGNKSEMSTGYSTLYGDMAGGFAVIKDVYKTLVYALSIYRNKIAGYNMIPENIIKKEPTAELRDNQKDSDSLPKYKILDNILYYYVEQHLSYAEIIKKGFNEKDVRKTIALVDRNEYKRRQAPPGIKVTKLAFGKDRRFPITNGYKLK